MAGNDVQFSLEQIQQFTVKQLQTFLRERGLKTVGRKAELQALAYSAVELGYKVKQTEVEEDRLRSEQYAELLNIDGKKFQTPLSILTQNLHKRSLEEKKITLVCMKP